MRASRIQDFDPNGIEDRFIGQSVHRFAGFVSLSSVRAARDYCVGPFTIMIVFALPLLLLLEFGGVGLETRSRGAPETAVVAYTLAPGEVGASVETVTVARRGAARTITIERKADKESQTETQPLTAGEFEKIWAIVIRDKLLEFTPEEKPGAVFDWGEAALRIETRTKTGDPPRVRQHRWTHPLKNRERLHALVPALARLAHAHARIIKLDNFAH